MAEDDCALEGVKEVSALALSKGGLAAVGLVSAIAPVVRYDANIEAELTAGKELLSEDGVLSGPFGAGNAVGYGDEFIPGMRFDGSPSLAGDALPLVKIGEILETMVPREVVVSADINSPPVPLTPQVIGNDIGVACIAGTGVVVVTVRERPGNAA